MNRANQQIRFVVGLSGIILLSFIAHLTRLEQQQQQQQQQRNHVSSKYSSLHSLRCPRSNFVMWNSSYHDYWQSRNVITTTDQQQQQQFYDHNSSNITLSVTSTNLSHFCPWNWDDRMAYQLHIEQRSSTNRDWIRSSPRYHADSPILQLINGVRVAFVGDSVTRFQSLSLMHYMHTGYWITDEMKPNFLTDVKEQKKDWGFSSWNEVADYTTLYFSGLVTNTYSSPTTDDAFRSQYFLTCDCYKVENFTLRNLVYNHFYYDPCRGNAVYNIGKYGHATFHGHYRPSQATNNPYNVSLLMTPFQWEYESWSSFIINYLALLQPSPKYVIINAGLWARHGLDQVGVFSEIRQALDLVNMTGIYKTTTSSKLEGFRQGMKLPVAESMNHSLSADTYFVNYKKYDHDAIGCETLHHCLSSHWTRYIKGPLHYVDNVHFQPHIYTLLNEQVLDLLTMLESS
jgi:hypothetical protein